MDRRDEWFVPEQVEEQIEQSQQSAEHTSVNSQMVHDLQSISKDEARRLVIIRERLIGYSSGSVQREPVLLQNYQNPEKLPQPRPEFKRAQKRSQLLIKLISGVAAVFVIASMLLVFARFKPHQEQGHLNLKTPIIISTPYGVIQGKSAFLLDTTSGKVLIDRNGHSRLSIGSLALVMTAVVAIDSANLDQNITIERPALNEVPAGASTAQLVVGDQLSLRDLLSALLLSSGTDAALVIARAVGGSTQGFVTMMNEEAQQLRLNDTHFSSSYGSSAPDQYSSAADLTYLTQYALQLSDFAQAVAEPEHRLAATSTSHSYLWPTTNTLPVSYPGMTIIKTGYTTQSGASVVFSVRRNDHLLVGTESGASSKNVLAADIKKLLGK